MKSVHPCLQAAVCWQAFTTCHGGSGRLAPAGGHGSSGVTEVAAACAVTGRYRLCHPRFRHDPCGNAAQGHDHAVTVGRVHCRARSQGHNLLITGATGTGKTWLACALGHQACRQGLSVRYLRLPRLFEELQIRHGDGQGGTIPRLKRRIIN